MGNETAVPSSRVALDHRQNEYGLDHPGVHEVFHNLCVSLENQADDHKLLTFLDGYLETYTSHLERRQLTRARTCCTSRSRGQPCCWYALRSTLDAEEELTLKKIVAAQGKVLGGAHEDTILAQ